MTERYFIKFPNTVYANTQCKNITLRPVLSDKLDSTPSLFYKYALKTGARADIIASNYYEDPYYEWLIYLNNKIVDPYYGWHLNDYDFEQFIKKKYGSVEQAQKKIYYYQLNWTNDDNEITPSFYNSTLPYVLRKYYTPVFGSSDKIIAYKRRESEVFSNTNKLLHFDVTITSGNGYVVGEILDIKNSSLTAVVGGAEVVFSNTTVVKVKNISGNTSATNKLVGESTNTIATITNTDILYENLTDEEAVYWSPVYFYEYEVDKNEANRNLRLLHSNYTLEAAEELRTILKE
jgi:hypothetical protein